MALEHEAYFESDDFSEWSNTSLDANYIDTVSPGLDSSSYKCQLTYDPSVTLHNVYEFVSTDLGLDTDTVTELRFGCRWQPNSLAFNPSGECAKFTFVTFETSGASASKLFNIQVIDGGSSTYDLKAVLEDDSGSETTLTATVGVSDGSENTVELYLVKPTDSTSADGEAYLYVNGNLEDSVTNLDNWDAWNGADASGNRYIIHPQSTSVSSCDPGGGISVDSTILRSDSQEIFPTINTFRFLGFDADTGTLMVSGLKDEATLKLYDYDLDTLTENGTASFGSATDTELDNRTRGIFPVAKPLEDDVWYLRGRDGNNVQVQYNDRNGTAGWTDLGPGTATWGTAKYAVGLLTTPMVSDDVIVAFDDADVYRTRYGTETWVKMGTAPTGLRAGARHPTRFNELLLAGTVGGTMHYSPNFGASFTDASNDVGVSDAVSEKRVAAGADDGWVQQPSTFFDSLSNVSFGQVSGDDADAWFRFQGVQIPNSATIANAYLEFVSDSARTGSLSLDITGEDDDSPTAPTDAADYNSRTRTSGTVNWTPGDWADGETYQTDDISTVIQEIVNRAGWAPGNAMNIFVERSTGTVRRIAKAYEGSAGQAALLHVEYSDSDMLINAIEVSL